MRSDIVIEPLTKDRLGEAIDVAAAAFGEKFRPEAEIDFTVGFSDYPRPFSTLAAIKKDEIVGLSQCFTAYFSYGTYAIGWICVAPKHQRQGIGSHIVERSCAYIESEFLKGRSGTILLASDARPSFYEKFGFEQKFHLHSGEPVMAKTIEGSK